MAISPTTKKAIIDGGPIPTHHWTILLDLRVPSSGVFRSITGTLVHECEKGSPLITMQAAMWYAVQVSFTCTFPAVFLAHLRPFQWAFNSYASEGSREIKEKPMEALKRLGHAKLKLDEYESAFAHSRLHFSVAISFQSGSRPKLSTQMISTLHSQVRPRRTLSGVLTFLFL